MMINKSFFGIVVMASASINAFITPFGFIKSNDSPGFAQRHSSTLFVGPSSGSSLAKPSVEIGQKTAVGTKVTQKSKTASKQRIQTDEPVRRKEPNIEDAPMFKVMLIGDEEYEQAYCIQRITEVMEDIDENRASIVFQQAQQSGKSMCGKYPYEHAELYVEQLLRSDPMIYSELEEENKKKK